MICLIALVGGVVCLFSSRYMCGDLRYKKFFLNMFVLLSSVSFMAVSDNTILFLIAWGTCNWTLVNLMVHKSNWKAAKGAGTIATKNFALGFASISLAFGIFYVVTGSLSTQVIVSSTPHSWLMSIALLFLTIGAMTQSAIWPFHRWLTSSLNSPTPVSAIMHAGVVNGGGLLLARFAPLYFGAPTILNLIFIVGLISAILGSLWKLMQHDVKRMLACSTLGQMGFMFVQCGLGLFGAALAHLVWHGMFKAYLFLASGDAAKQKRLDLNHSPGLLNIFLSLACGALGAYIFSKIIRYDWLQFDTRFVIIAVVFFSAAQLALTLLGTEPFKKLPAATVMTTLLAASYGVNVHFFEWILAPLNVIRPLPLNGFHISGLILLCLAWIFVVIVKQSDQSAKLPNWVLGLYVKMLNASQPHPSSITAHRKGYEYV